MFSTALKQWAERSFAPVRVATHGQISAQRRSSWSLTGICVLVILAGCSSRTEPVDADNSPVNPQFDIFLNQPGTVSNGLQGNISGATGDSAPPGTPIENPSSEPSSGAGDSQSPQLPAPSVQSPQNGEGTDTAPNDGFTLAALPVVRLLEGDPVGTTISVTVARESEHAQPVRFALTSDDSTSLRGLSIDFQPVQISAQDTSTQLTIRLEISALPRLPSSRTLKLSAQDGLRVRSTALIIDIIPIAAPDIYLLVGANNMLGKALPGGLQAGAGQADAPVSRIQQLRVSNNLQTNTDDAIVLARDPLHEALTRVDTLSASPGLGLSFAKRALPNTTQKIILVPAAFADSGFCHVQHSGWHPDLSFGNTDLFDRAIERVDRAIELSDGIVRGVLWHQGEADATADCSRLYGANLSRLVSALRSHLPMDARGMQARGPQARLPFIVGTLSRGADARGDFSVPDEANAILDSVLRNIDQAVPFSASVFLDDLVPSNGFPCAAENCRQFGAAALREAGIRYFEGLTNAATR